MIYYYCIQAKQSKRLNNNEIRSLLTKENNSFRYLLNYLLENEATIMDINQFITESIMTQIGNKDLSNITEKVSFFQFLYSLKNNGSKSSFYYHIGNIFFNGNLARQNYEKAKFYYEMSAIQKNSDAYYKLGYLYFKGYGVKKNLYIALEYFKLSAKQNNEYGILYLAHFYFSIKKYELAKYYYEKLEVIHNSFALLFLGIYHEKGYCDEINNNKAKKYYELSAQQNNSYGYLYLGRLYEKGRGVKQNYYKAKELYEESAKLNNSSALYRIGNLHYYGYETLQDYSRVKEYYKSMTEKSDFYCIWYLSGAFSNIHNIYMPYANRIL